MHTVETTVSVDEQKVVVRNAITEFIDFMNNKAGAMYSVDGGRKYLRIISEEMRSVHCFVEALTGDVYMAASFAKPMLNGARFNLLDADSFAKLKESWDPYGSYLYKKR